MNAKFEAIKQGRAILRNGKVEIVPQEYSEEHALSEQEKERLV